MNQNKYIKFFTILKILTIINSLYSIITMLTNSFISIITHVPLLTVCSIIVNIIFLIALNKEDFDKLNTISSINIGASIINIIYEFILLQTKLTGINIDLKIAYIVILLLLKLPLLILNIKMLLKCHNHNVKFTGFSTIFYIILYFAFVAISLYITSIPESNLEFSIQINTIIGFLLTVAIYYLFERSIEAL